MLELFVVDLCAEPGSFVVAMGSSSLHDVGSDFRLYDGSNLKTYLLMLWLFVGPTGVYQLDFSWSCIQLYLLLCHYLCFISFLYLDLYVLGDDALIS